MIIERNHVTTLVIRATRFTRDRSAGVVSCIVVSVMAPRIGRMISVVSMVKDKYIGNR